ncbi:carbohydrate porin [Corallincola spongiicola]|uniref:Maltoporin n=1 Tax=Corallincola spongiicola TaxID=2520508 RepID=A0ABY1WMV7_9GAMM|nr:carbohydrate porin [Corallincola spongiicola]TAA43755.1 maltoporin precursor [Corallincola spongiicola]
MAKIKALPIALAIASALTAASASAVEFHGYARAGLSTTGAGGEQTCYGSGAGGHYVGRLGDECDTYVELDLAQEVYNRDGKVFRIEAMWASDIGSQGNDFQGNNGDAPWGGAEWAFRQFFSTAKGVLGFAPEATVWAGKRYYQRKDVHILDYYYLNNSGYGAGIEGIKMGPGQFSFAWTNMDQNGNDKDGNGTVLQNNKLDLRYAGIPLWGDANLELVGIAAFADDSDAQNVETEDGLLAMAEISHSLLGGFNKMSFTYASDSLADSVYDNHTGGNVRGIKGAWGDDAETAYRFLDWGVVKFGKNVEVGYAFLYQHKEQISDNEVDRMSIVARPVYKIDDVQSIALEVGYTNEDPDNGDEQDLSKAVVSYNISAGKSFWARPQIRFYGGSFWGDLAENNTSSDPDGDDGNFRFGAQVEAWW